LFKKNVKIIYFDQFLSPVIFSQANPDMPQQVADLISQSQFTQEKVKKNDRLDITILKENDSSYCYVRNYTMMPLKA